MTRPLDPHAMSEEALARQLKRRLPADDRRGRDLLNELELRLWARKFELESLNTAVSDLGREIDRLGSGVREAVDLLGGRPPRPTLRLVECHDA